MLIDGAFVKNLKCISIGADVTHVFVTESVLDSNMIEGVDFLKQLGI